MQDNNQRDDMNEFQGTITARSVLTAVCGIIGISLLLWASFNVESIWNWVFSL